ncbi:MAG: hypothetical protein PSX36_11685 [bacterium]|nr:hypothetical protein [bacterium]
MKKNTLCLLISISLFLTTCKKGEDDPLLSLRTRKARVEGDWMLESATVNLEFINFTQNTRLAENLYLQGPSLVGTEINGTVPYQVSYLFLLSVKFDKKGGFRLKETFSNNVIEASGIWDFDYGLGPDKRKEELTISLTDVSSGSTGSHIFNQFGTTFSYKIKELRNKKMVLKVSALTYSNKNGEEDTMSAEFTFTQ